MRPSKRESGAVGSSGVIVFPSSPPSPCPYPVHVSTRHSAQEVQTIDSFSLSSRLSPCIARSPRYSARDSFEDRDPSVCAERSRESRLWSVSKTMGEGRRSRGESGEIISTGWCGARSFFLNFLPDRAWVYVSFIRYFNTDVYVYRRYWIFKGILYFTFILSFLNIKSYKWNLE